MVKTLKSFTSARIPTFFLMMMMTMILMCVLSGIMKPPSRPRIRPSRFVDKKGAEPLNRFAPRPNGMEMRSLLLALKQQKSLNTELDYLALRKHVPKWSLHQVCLSAINF